MKNEYFKLPINLSDSTISSFKSNDATISAIGKWTSDLPNLITTLNQLKEQKRISGQEIPFMWGPEYYNDINQNRKYDKEEPYEDLNGNGKYDFGEEYTDINRNNYYLMRKFIQPILFYF